MGTRTIAFDPDAYTDNIRRFVSWADEHEQAEGLAWYETARSLCRAIGDRTNIPTDIVAAVVSALSPRVWWATNIADAAAYCEAADMGLDMPSAATFTKNRIKAWDILTSGRPWREILRGIKVESFVANIMGDMKRVTVDTWAVRGATAGAEDEVRTEAHYRAIERAYKIVADELGLEPAELQAIVWVVVKNRCDIRGKGNTRDARMARLAA